MAYRKRTLDQRIYGQAADHPAAMASAHPAVPAPMVLPLAQVTVNPVSSDYVTLAMQDLMPVITADGAMVPASGPGRWDQLALAGGGRHG